MKHREIWALSWQNMQLRVRSIHKSSKGGYVVKIHSSKSSAISVLTVWTFSGSFGLDGKEHGRDLPATTVETVKCKSYSRCAKWSLIFRPIPSRITLAPIVKTVTTYWKLHNPDKTFVDKRQLPYLYLRWCSYESLTPLHPRIWEAMA